jgi:hypothetical protein
MDGRGYPRNCDRCGHMTWLEVDQREMIVSGVFTCPPCFSRFVNICISKSIERGTYKNMAWTWFQEEAPGSSYNDMSHHEA